MAIVLALVIVGWLVAFALGAQAGFENSTPAAVQQSIEEAPAISQRSLSKKQASAA